MFTANDNLRAQNKALARHYRPIGPAAILAALMFAPKARAKHRQPVYAGW